MSKVNIRNWWLLIGWFVQLIMVIWQLICNYGALGSSGCGNCVQGGEPECVFSNGIFIEICLELFMKLSWALSPSKYFSSCTHADLTQFPFLDEFWNFFVISWILHYRGLFQCVMMEESGIGLPQCRSSLRDTFFQISREYQKFTIP